MLGTQNVNFNTKYCTASSDENKSDDKSDKKTKTSKTKQTKKVEFDEATWKQLFEKEIKSDTRRDFKGLNYLQIGVFFVASHIIGVMIMNMPQQLSKIGLDYGYSTELSVYIGFAVISGALLLAPLLLSVRMCHKSMAVLNILSLLELGTALICVSMNNFSLALYAATIYAPLALAIGHTRNR